MSEKRSPVDVANRVAAYASGSAMLAAFAVDRLKTFGVEFGTDLPVLKQFVEHAGNLVLGGTLACGIVFTASKIEKKVGHLTTAQRVVGIGAMGLAVGAGFNAVSDTQVGMDYVGKHLYQCGKADPAENGRYCTVDTGDFLGGAIGAGAFSVSLAQWRKPDLRDSNALTHAVAGAGEPPAATQQAPNTIVNVSLPFEVPTNQTLSIEK